MIRVGKQVTVTLTDDQVARCNKLSERLGISFAGAIRLALSTGVPAVERRTPAKKAKKGARA